MKVEWKKLMFGLAIGAGMMMMASCSDEENFDPGGSTGKETPEPTEKAFLSMRLSTGSLAGTRVAVDPTTSGRTEEQVVNHVRMVLYETKNNTVRYSWDLNVSTDGMNEFTGGDVVRGEDVPSATPTSTNASAMKGSSNVFVTQPCQQQTAAPLAHVSRMNSIA